VGDGRSENCEDSIGSSKSSRLLDPPTSKRNFWGDDALELNLSFSSSERMYAALLVGSDGSSFNAFVALGLRVAADWTGLSNVSTALAKGSVTWILYFWVSFRLWTTQRSKPIRKKPPTKLIESIPSKLKLRGSLAPADGAAVKDKVGVRVGDWFTVSIVYPKTVNVTVMFANATELLARIEENVLLFTELRREDFTDENTVAVDPELTSSMLNVKCKLHSIEIPEELVPAARRCWDFSSTSGSNSPNRLLVVDEMESMEMSFEDARPTIVATEVLKADWALALKSSLDIPFKEVFMGHTRTVNTNLSWDGLAVGTPDGCVEGSADGELRGCDDGCEVGWLWGCAEGFEEGVTEGIAVGNDAGCPDGCAEGCENGCAEGLALGFRVGWLVGSEVGLELGNDEGVTLGDAEGWLDGWEVGFETGFPVGCTEGRKEGLLNGCLLGTVLGLIEGFSVGVLEGLVLGNEEGDEVG